jgi:hypothetical protein
MADAIDTGLRAGMPIAAALAGVLDVMRRSDVEVSPGENVSGDEWDNAMQRATNALSTFNRRVNRRARA